MVNLNLNPKSTHVPNDYQTRGGGVSRLRLGSRSIAAGQLESLESEVGGVSGVVPRMGVKHCGRGGLESARQNDHWGISGRKGKILH